MLYKINVFGDEAHLKKFMCHVNDLFNNKDYLRKIVEVQTVNKNNVSITVESNSKAEVVFFPLITFDRSKTKKSEDFILDFVFQDDDKDFEKRFDFLVRDIMCGQLSGYLEFVGNKIVVSDEHIIESFDTGCSLILGAETDFIAKLDFINSGFLL